MRDLQGRSYLTSAEAAVGVEVETDGDFTCRKPHQRSKIEADADGDLFIQCDHGQHLLGGQLSNDSTHYKGVYRV